MATRLRPGAGACSSGRTLPGRVIGLAGVPLRRSRAAQAAPCSHVHPAARLARVVLAAALDACVTARPFSHAGKALLRDLWAESDTARTRPLPAATTVMTWWCMPLGAMNAARPAGQRRPCSAFLAAAAAVCFMLCLPTALAQLDAGDQCGGTSCPSVAFAALCGDEPWAGATCGGEANCERINGSVWQVGRHGRVPAQQGGPVVGCQDHRFCRQGLGMAASAA